MGPIQWLVLFVVLLGIEIMTMGLTTIWFAGGALAAFFASLFSFHLAVQITVFVAASLLLLLFTRPAALRYLNQRTVKTNVESMEGRIGIVTEDIHNLEAKGEVQVSGMTWTARAETDETPLEKGTRVRVLRVDGVKLIVKEDKEDEN